jgi:thymidine kinase
MSLSVYTGSMFSGKTTNLLSDITRYMDVSQGHKALIINHSLDCRDQENGISSHSSMYKGISEKIIVMKTRVLGDIDIEGFEYIGIDEANFFDDLIEVVKVWIKKGKHVTVAGLDGDFKMNTFGHISKLLCIADRFVKLSGICSICLKETIQRGETVTPYNTTPAPFTRRLKSESTNQIDIGGSDKYIAVCRKHHQNSLENF